MIEHDENTQNLVDALYLYGFKGHLNDLYFAIGAGRRDKAFLEKFITSVIPQ